MAAALRQSHPWRGLSQGPRAGPDRARGRQGKRHSEAYSAFAGTDLEVWLRARGVKCLYIAGLATDYCVKQSVLDALRLGFEVIVLEDAVAAVDVRPGDGDKALEEMVAAGAELARRG